MTNEDYQDYQESRKSKQVVPEQQSVANTFEKGLWMDSQTSVQPEGTYSGAVNIINRDEYQNSFRSNEHGTSKLLGFPDVIGDIYIKDRDYTIFITKGGELYYYSFLKEGSADAKVFIASFTEFGCKMDVRDCEYINIQYAIKGCDLHIYWSSDDTYYWMNISEMLDPKRKSTLKDKLSGSCNDCNNNCTYFKIFKPKTQPKIDLFHSDKGGSLSAGTYVAVLRQLNEDGSPTNYNTPSRTVHIGSEYNIPGEDATGRLTIDICNLDCNYVKLDLVVVYYNGSTITAKSSLHYFSSDKHTISYDQFEGEPIDPKEVLLKSSINLEGSDLFNYDDYMYYFGIIPRKEYNIQKIANNIQVEWVAEKYSIEDAKKYNIKTIPYGESLAFGIVINHDDGTHSYAGHIPNIGPGGTSGGTGNRTALAIVNTGTGVQNVDLAVPAPGVPAPGGIAPIQITGSTGQTSQSIHIEKHIEYERKRTKHVETIQNCNNEDELIKIERALVDSWSTDSKDLIDIVAPACLGGGDVNSCIEENTGSPCGPDDINELVGQDCCPDEINQFCNVRDAQKNANIIAKDIIKSDQMFSKWSSILADYIGEDGRKDLELRFRPGTIKQAAQEILTNIEKRERIFQKEQKYIVTKGVNYDTGSKTYEDDVRKPNDHIDTPTAKKLGAQYPNGVIVATGKTKPKTESINYPCIRDCFGNFIYAGLTGKPITHHLFPDETELTFFESKAVGVPSKSTPDAFEHKDAYGIYLGAVFSNISIDREDYYKTTGKRVATTNPFTIVQAKITYSNKTILTKGLILSNYVSTNKGKQYDFTKHAVNSRERVNRYIDIGGQRIDTGAGPSNTVCMYSLDQQVLQPHIGGATQLKIVQRMSGVGHRHYLYREGSKPDNLTFGKRVDQRGTVSATNLSTLSANSATFNINFAKYITGGIDSVEAPGSGGTNPLMNKYGQDCLWIGLTSNYSVDDNSFTGDVLTHEAPISLAIGDYAVLRRDLPNQYGNLESIRYIPIIEDCGNATVVKGLFGDRFIAPYSYVKTTYVSDKVGNKFPIANMVPGKWERSICDNPDDAINSLVGKFCWTQLPKDADKADAKNWAGTQTPGDAVSLTWIQANGTPSKTHYYYPGTLTHLNTFGSESEANPFTVELSDELQNQRYPYLRKSWFLEATDHPWEDSYLSQFYIRNEQPSAAQKMMKILGKSLANLILPLLKLEDVFSPDGALDLTGDLTSLPIWVAIYFLISKVLLTDTFLDELIGLPICKMDSEDGIEFKIEKFFKNFDKYSHIFNKTRDLYQYVGMQEFTNCGCTRETINRIHISDRQNQNSLIDGFKTVRPNNYVDINQSDGKLRDMFTSPVGGLFGHTTDAIIAIIDPQTVIPTTGLFDLITGNRSINVRRVVGSSYEGNAGIVDRNHAINSRYGRYFIDYESNELFVFNGSDVRPLSLEKGANVLFKNYIKYCSTGCANEFVKRDYALGIDPRFHRLLISKNDGEYSWTISYDLIQENFISFHTYNPRKYLFTREDMYALKDDYLHSFKKTQDIDSKYNNYFGEQHPFSIDIKSVLPVTANYESHIIRTNVEQNDKGKLIKNMHVHFDEIAFWNSFQSGGVHDLKMRLDSANDNSSQNKKLPDNYGTLPIDRKNNEWRINEFYDFTGDPFGAVVQKKDCLPFIEPINYGFKGLNEQNYKDRILRDNVFFTRLTKTLPDKKMYIKNLLLLYNRKSR